MKHTYTVRYAHLREPSPLKVNDFVGRGFVVGIMGNTGQSTGAHLHIDVTRGRNAKAFKLADIVAPDFKQLALFIDEELGASAANRMREWAVENSRDKRPGHSYTLEKFGFTEEGLRRDFANYLAFMKSL